MTNKRLLQARIRELEERLARLMEDNVRLAELLISGERLRENLMVKAILAGAFNPK